MIKYNQLDIDLINSLIIILRHKKRTLFTSVPMNTRDL